MLNRAEIEEKRFREAFRGYHREEVDSFLDLLADELEALQVENAALKRQLEELKEAAEKGREAELSLGRALAAAERAASELVAEARREAERVLQEAREEAEEILVRAEEEARARRDRLEAECRELEERLDSLRALREEMASTLREFLSRALERVGELGRDVAAEVSSETEASSETEPSSEGEASSEAEQRVG